MVTKVELLTTINELELQLNNRNVIYDVVNVSIKSLKVELQNYLTYLVSVNDTNAITNLTKYETSNTKLDVNNDVRLDNLNSGNSFSVDDQVMQVNIISYSTVTDKKVQLPEIQTEIEKIEVAAISSLTSNYTNDNELAVSGSGQDLLFWLRRVSIELSNQVLTQSQYSHLKEKQIAGDFTVNHLLERSEQIKKYLTFRCEELKQDDRDYCNRLGWIIDTDPVFGDIIVCPDFETVNTIKFSTIIRLLKYRINNPLLVTNESLHNRYFGKDELLHCPLIIALDLLTDHIGVNHDNFVLASALRLNLLNVDRTVSVKRSNGIEVHRALHTTFVVPSEVREAITNSVTVRSIGKVKKAVISQRNKSKTSSQRDSWQLLSINRNTVESEIIAINSASYRDCVLVFKKYQLEYNNITKNHNHPTWLLRTQQRYGIKDTDIVGYVGIKYPNGEIEKIGIVHTKYVKKQDKTVLWFTLLEKTATTVSNQVVNTGKVNTEQYVKYITDGVTIKKQLTTRLVPETTLASVTEVAKIDIDPQIAIFLSLYGLCHNTAIKPSKLNTINGESKHINVNWSILSGLKVAPINKAGDIQWHPKYQCPFTVLA